MLHETRKRAILANLPRYVIFDSRSGHVKPEHQEAERQAAAMGIHLKEYVDFDPDAEEGTEP